jgi:ribosomal protein S18 acetylase RimI-like enzyme
MSLRDRVSVIRVADEDGRNMALSVMRAIYRDEKNWIQEDRKLFPREEVDTNHTSWFVARIGSQPVGVLRVLYELPLDLYAEYGFKQIGNGMDLEAFVRNSRIAEIGRFAVLPEFRRLPIVASALMRTASRETLERDYTHYITDIFEGEVHSPYEFHTRVMGFHAVATHDVGELNCPNRRITMILDLKAAYQRLRRSQNWIFRFLTEDWPDELHRKLMPERDFAATTGR